VYANVIDTLILLLLVAWCAMDRLNIYIEIK
jgi:hypothetical protein